MKVMVLIFCVLILTYYDKHPLTTLSMLRKKSDINVVNGKMKKRIHIKDEGVIREYTTHEFYPNTDINRGLF